MYEEIKKRLQKIATIFKKNVKLYEITECVNGKVSRRYVIARNNVNIHQREYRKFAERGGSTVENWYSISIHTADFD